MKLLRLLTLSLSMVLGFACSDSDLEGVDPATASGEQSSSGKRVIEITAGSIESKMVVGDSGEGTPISINWNASDIIGMWTYKAADYSTYSENDKILKGTITALTNGGKTATFSSDEASAEDPADMARLLFPYDAGSTALSEGGTAGALSLYNINLSRQQATIAPYADGMAYEYSHEKMYMISDAVAIGSSTIIRPITSLLRFYITAFDTSFAANSINIYKVVCRKTQSDDAENGSYIPVKASADLLAGIDPSNANEVLTVSGEGAIEVYASNPEYSTEMNSQVCFTIPTLPITINPNDKIYLDVYFSDGETKYVKSCEYSPKSINGSTTMSAGIAYDIAVELDINGSAVDTSALYSGGLGTEANPYILGSTADLAALQRAVNGGEGYEGVYFQLGGDVEFTSEPSIGFKADAPFKGNFDGNGYTLEVDNFACGLFGYVTGGTIKNLNVITRNAVSGVDNYAGGIVCFMSKNSTLIDCSFVTQIENIIIVASNCGGLVGYNAGSIIGCYASTTIAGGSTKGGLVSKNEGEIIGCFFVDQDYDTENYVLGDQICAKSEGGVCEANFYNSVSGDDTSKYGTLTENSFNSQEFVDEINAAIFTYNMTATNRVRAWAVNEDADSLFPIRTSTYPSGKLSSSTDEGDWNDLVTIDVDYDVISNELAGSGTSDDPFLIESELDFAMLSKYYSTNKVNGVDYGKCYLLTRDLDLSGRHWVAIGLENTVHWDGVFDGGGHKITGLYIANQGQCSALFKFVTGFSATDPAVIKNLSVENATIETTTKKQVGGICASLGSYAYACNISVTGSITGSNTAGGIAGQAYGGTFVNCYSKVAVKTVAAAPSRNGGITGLISSVSSLIGCYSDYVPGASSVTDYSYGALVGGNQGGIISGCYWRFASSSFTARAYSGETKNNYDGSYVTEDVDGEYVRVDSKTNEEVVELLNEGLVSYQNNYANVGLKPCKWKLDDNGDVALDFGNYIEGSDVGTDIPGSGTNPDGGL